jgi:hypothetical protein
LKPIQQAMRGKDNKIRVVHIQERHHHKIISGIGISAFVAFAAFFFISQSAFVAVMPVGNIQRLILKIIAELLDVLRLGYHPDIMPLTIQFFSGYQ